MKRRGFLKMLAALVVAPKVPLPEVGVPAEAVTESAYVWKQVAGTWTVSRAGYTQTVGDLIASTLANTREEIANNIFRESTYLARLNLNSDRTYTGDRLPKRERKRVRKRLIRDRERRWREAMG